jgi:bacillithiol system protein YtxJ
MNWIKLEDSIHLQDLINKTVDNPSLTVLLFKHSTRCSISSMVKRRLDNLCLSSSAIAVYLDLIAFRTISNEIAQYFNLEHESPQLLIIRSGKLIDYTNHTSINEGFVSKFSV